MHRSGDLLSVLLHLLGLRVPEVAPRDARHADVDVDLALERRDGVRRDGGLGQRDVVEHRQRVGATAVRRELAMPCPSPRMLGSPPWPAAWSRRSASGP